MPIFSLDENISFPHPQNAMENGLLAVGGDLSVPRLICAYRNGIFPWYDGNTPILWWSPDPRMVLFPQNLHISKRAKRLLNQKQYSVCLNSNFEEIIKNCASVRNRAIDGTWIIPEMVEAYINLEQANFIRCASVWEDNVMIGGCYGVRLGDIFFGESMFSLKSGVSRLAFIKLVEYLKAEGCICIDCQQKTTYLESLGAFEITRTSFLDILKKGLKNGK